MLAQQRKAGQAMIERCVLPVPLVVTFIAELSFLPLMLVVLLVAEVTIRLELFLVKVPFVAALTFRGLVLPFQWIFRVATMVERGRLPVFLRVATLAFLPIRTLMLVILLVTGQAEGGCLVPIQMPLMAVLAFGRLVLTLEGILGVAIMVERNRLPVLLHVAILALRTKDSFVFIVFLMARETFGRSLRIRDRDLVTAFALRFRVLAL